MPSNLTSKLQLEPGQALFVLNVPDEIEPYLMKQMPDISLISAPYDITTATLIFVKTLVEARRSLSLVASIVGENGIFWLAYPKSTSGINTDITRSVLKTAFQPDGLQFGRQIALNQTWSAVQFHPPFEIK
jgi:hypothetical protein